MKKDDLSRADGVGETVADIVGSVFSEDGKRKIMEVDKVGRITYVGRLFHANDLGFDEIRVGPNGTEIRKGPPVYPILRGELP